MASLSATIIILIIVFLLWRFWFFLRNPKREPPMGNGFLAPADGFVVYVKRVELGQIPIAIKGKSRIPLYEYIGFRSPSGLSGYLVGVFMTAFSVHRNRIPLSGIVKVKIRSKANENFSTVRLVTNMILGRRPYENDCEHIVHNERVAMTIETRKGPYFVIQIADKWISHIVNIAEIGEYVERGSIFGMIRFGSQVDVFIPDSLGYKPTVDPGTYVYAGKSIVAAQINLNL